MARLDKDYEERRARHWILFFSFWMTNPDICFFERMTQTLAAYRFTGAKTLEPLGY